MTITEMTAVMLAAQNGAKIEMRCMYGDNQWEPVRPPAWNWGICDYRVAEFPQEQDDE